MSQDAEIECRKKGESNSDPFSLWFRSNAGLCIVYGRPRGIDQEVSIVRVLCANELYT